MRTAAILFAVAVQLVAVPVAARERLLAPTDEWRLQPADENCRLVRNFADAEGKGVRLQLQSFGPVEGFKITMVGDGLPLSSGRRGVAPFKYRFKPDPKWRETYGTTGYVDGADALTFRGDFATSAEFERRRDVDNGDIPELWAPYMRARALEVDALALVYRRSTDMVLQLGSMAEPFAQLNECAQELVGKWGYDPAQQASLRSPPQLLNVPRISEALLGALRQGGLGHNDTIQFRIDIDERGGQTGCTVQHPRRGSEVEALVCDTLRATGQFEPALDANGVPVAAPYISTVMFGFR